MDLELALLIYLLLIVAIYLISRNYGIRAFSALILALLVGGLALGIIYPYSNISQDLHRKGVSHLIKTSVIFYFLIQLLTGICLIFYILKSVKDDRERLA